MDPCCFTGTVRHVVIPQHSCVLLHPPKSCAFPPHSCCRHCLPQMAQAANSSCSTCSCAVCWPSHRLPFCVKSPNPMLGCEASGFYHLTCKAQTLWFCFYISLTDSRCLSVAPSWSLDTESSKRSVLCSSHPWDERGSCFPVSPPMSPRAVEALLITTLQTSGLPHYLVLSVLSHRKFPLKLYFQHSLTTEFEQLAKANLGFFKKV